MTREQFLEDIVDICQLMDFCYEYGFDDEVADVYSQASYKEWVWSSIQDWYGDWESLASWLYNLPETSDYDYFDLSDEPCGVGDYEFDYYKERVLEAADHNDFWDDTDEYEIEEAPEEPPKPDDTEFMLLIAS